jgi:hypothetical protein
MKRKPQLTVVGTETRRCTECGARWSNCPDDATICKLCGGDLARPLSEWTK